MAAPQALAQAIKEAKEQHPDMSVTRVVVHKETELTEEEDWLNSGNNNSKIISRFILNEKCFQNYIKILNHPGKVALSDLVEGN